MLVDSKYFKICSAVIVAFALTLLCQGCGSGVSSAQGEKQSDETTSDDGNTKKAEGKKPKGPRAKAVIDNAVHQLGNIETHTSHSHTFVIRNEGDAPLTLKNNGTTCQCTLSDLEEVTVEPGGQHEITLTWKPEHPTEKFSKGANIGTNDPDQRLIALRGEAKVSGVLDAKPSGAWTVGSLFKSKPSHFEGTVYSRVKENIEIVEMTADSSKVELDSEPITDKKVLESLDAKCAHKVLVKVLPGLPVGDFVSYINVKVNAGGEMDMKFEVRGRRSGPYLIQGPSNWVASHNLIDFKRFPAAEGKTVKLTMYLEKNDDAKEPLKVIEQTADPEFVKVKIEHDEKFKSPIKDRYRLEFSIPPKTPPTTLSLGRHGTLILKTNHPVVSEVSIKVHMQSF